MVVNLIFIAFLLSNSRRWPPYTVSLGAALHYCFLISDGSQKYAPHIGQEWSIIPRRDRSTVPDMELNVSHCGVRDCAFRDPSGNIVRFSQTRCQARL